MQVYEIKLAGLRKTKDGTLVTFVIHHAEDLSVLLYSDVGACFHATFEPIDYDNPSPPPEE